MLTNTEIHKIYQEMKQWKGIITDAYPPYYINLSEKHIITLYGTFGYSFSIPSNQLSDVHAILQLCHPNTPYYIYHDVYLSEELPDIPLYSYKHAPNILTTQSPPNQKNNTYTIQPTSISQTIIQPNEPIKDAIIRIREQVKKTLQFVHQYPNINVNPQQLNSLQKIPHMNNTEIRITARRAHPSNMEITLAISNEYSWASIDSFIIPTQHITKLTDKYIAHMHRIAPDLIRDIQQNFAGSQHEKMRIIRQVIPYLTHTNNDLFTCIQDCAHVLMNHYAYNHAPLTSPP